jgi:hypothetical protein
MKPVRLEATLPGYGAIAVEADPGRGGDGARAQVLAITFPGEWVDLLPEDDAMVEAPERQVGRSIGAWLEDPRRSASDKWRPA